MKQIYLVDYLGVHCGMHYYLEAFKNVLSDIPESEVTILSNYPNKKGEKSFFINQYQGNKFTKAVALLKNLLSLKRFIKRHPDGIYIYLTYGNFIDIPFIKLITKAQNHIIDIHEAIAQNIDNNRLLKLRFKKIYQNKVNTVVSHSTRTDDFLSEYGYKSKRLFVPHFKYVFPKEYDTSNIAAEVLAAPVSDLINVLFFGNLNESKGVDILLESINKLDDNIADKLNFVIAGKDFDGAINRVAVKKNRNVKIFPRHITDDELRYLYQTADYVSLPYRKTSQSGILEMAFYFKRPIIASDIPYFRLTLTEFPSFGKIAGNTPGDYAVALSDLVKKHGKEIFFKEKDYDKYVNRTEIKHFVSEFTEWLGAK